MTPNAPQHPPIPPHATPAPPWQQQPSWPELNTTATRPGADTAEAEDDR